ncbi:hypothetical protein PT502_05765 [Aliarcobacter butzleri]|uniref:hypothetical protein n=1 Tax=Aliarcobacter butzleri TaxID=28197 RepID=UPI0024DEAAE5|nr:hypothetical protein [Aliarcobacter butzleri]MDK2083307.1 hypothetical protein [Aliarcobacter butzleri]
MVALNIEAIDGRAETINISEEKLEDLNKINEEILTKDKIKTYIDNLNISSEVKVFLNSIVNVTCKIGDMIYNIGKKIIEILIYLSKEFPNTTIGLIIGFVVGTLISSIPIIGWLLSGIILPASIFAGGLAGAYYDISDKATKQTINKYLDEMFGAFKDLNIGKK